MIEPVADLLSISHKRIYANTILFHPDGSYKDFDPKASEHPCLCCEKKVRPTC